MVKYLNLVQLIVIFFIDKKLKRNINYLLFITLFVHYKINMDTTQVHTNNKNADKIIDNSDFLLNIFESTFDPSEYEKTNKREFIIQILTKLTISKYFVCSIDYDKCVDILLNVIDKKYSEISINETNILDIVRLISYFLNDSKDFLEFIVGKFVLVDSKYYEHLHTHETINQIIVEQIENNLTPRLSDDIINILHKYNSSLIETRIKVLNTYNKNISQESHEKFKNLQILYANYCPKITSVNHLSETLIELHIRGNCGIHQIGIQELKVLQKLDAACNPNVNNVNHLSNTLIELDVRENCGIDQNGMQKCKLLQTLLTENNLKN